MASQIQIQFGAVFAPNKNSITRGRTLKNQLTYIYLFINLLDTFL